MCLVIYIRRVSLTLRFLCHRKISLREEVTFQHQTKERAVPRAVGGSELRKREAGSESH